MLVTLQEAKDHLRMDHDLDDSMIILYAQAASQSVVTYLKDASPYLLDEDGNIIKDENNNPVINPIVKAAVLILVGELYKNREANQDGTMPSGFGYGYLPLAVTRLLYPLRVPTCN